MLANYFEVLLSPKHSSIKVSFTFANLKGKRVKANDMPNTEHAVACKSTDHGVVGNIFILFVCSSILVSHFLGEGSQASSGMDAAGMLDWAMGMRFSGGGLTAQYSKLVRLRIN